MELRIFNLVFGSAIFWVGYLFTNRTLTKNYSQINSALLCGGLYIITAALYWFIEDFAAMPYICYVMGFLPFLIVPLLYKDPINRIVFIFFSSLLFCLMINITAIISSNLLIPYLGDINVDIVFQCILFAMIIIYLIMGMTFLGKTFQSCVKKADKKAMSYACALPLISILLLLTDFQMMENYTTWGYDIASILSMILILILVYVVLIRSFRSSTPINYQKNNQMQNPAMMRQNKMGPANPMELILLGTHYYEGILDHYKDMEQRSNILSHHLQTLNNLLLNDNVSAASVYLDKIDQDSHDYIYPPVCSLPSLNTVFSYYSYLCRKDHISFQVNLNIPNGLPIHELELCTLFGTAIENAIEACRFVKNERERFININAKVQQGRVMIIIDNSFDGFINVVNNNIRSRKKNGGSGIRLMRCICEKYRGTLNMEHPGNVFTLYAMMQLPQIPGYR